MKKLLVATAVLYALATLLFGIEGFLTAIVVHGLAALLFVVVVPLLSTDMIK